MLNGGIKVRLVRHGKKYYATNRLTLSAKGVRPVYRLRWQVEKIIKVCKDRLGIGGCQTRSLRAQEHHITGCLVAFCILERESHDRGMSIYKLKRRLSFKGRTPPLLALQRLRKAA